MAINNDHVYAGKYSLAVAFTNSAQVEVKPCPSAIPLGGYEIGGKVLLVGTDLSSAGCYVHAYTNIMEYVNIEVQGESWYDVSLPIPTSPMGDPAWTSPTIGVSVYCQSFTGTMYVDSMWLVK
jgi:hypothetical protein